MKNLYLTGIIILFIFVVYFFVENSSMWMQLYVFGSSKSFAWWFVVIFIVLTLLGSLITLYIQSILKEQKLKEYTNFDI